MKHGNKTILESLVSLFSIRTMDYILAFVTMPYLVRVLGVERYGAIAFAQSFCQYFSLVVAYAFDMIAPKDIAMHKDVLERRKIFASVMGAKILLLCLTSMIFLICLFLLPIFRNDSAVFVAVFIKVLGEAIFPVWYFQGIEKMRYITYVTLIARVISVTLIFLLVNYSEDAAVAAFLQSLTQIAAGLLSLIVLWRQDRKLFHLPDWQEVWYTLYDGWQLFYSSVAISLYTGSNMFFLGLLTNNTVVGYFAGAQKLMIAAKSIIDTTATAIYPHTSSLLSESKEKAIVFLLVWRRRLCMLGMLISGVGFVFADLIIKIILGPGYESSIVILRVIVWIPLVVTITQIYLIHTLIPFGYPSLYSRIVGTSALLNIVIIFPCIYVMQGVGVAVAMLITELYVALLSWYYVRKKDIWELHTF